MKIVNQRVTRAASLTAQDLKVYSLKLLGIIYILTMFAWAIVSRALGYAYALASELVKFVIAAAEELISAFS